MRGSCSVQASGDLLASFFCSLIRTEWRRGDYLIKAVSFSLLQRGPVAAKTPAQFDYAPRGPVAAKTQAQLDSAPPC